MAFILRTLPTATELRVLVGYVPLRITTNSKPELQKTSTVILGTFSVGMGDSSDTAKMGAFPAGPIWTPKCIILAERNSYVPSSARQEYVREQHALRLEEAVRKMASVTASRTGLMDRGILRPGMIADIAVFDPKTVKDVATDNDSLTILSA